MLCCTGRTTISCCGSSWGTEEAGFDAVKYSRQRLVDNVQLLTPELVLKVIHLIVRTGHKVAGKKSGAALAGRCDSRVVKTHVHYPTDVGLCWDAVRGLIRVSARSAAAFALPGWRKHADRTRKVYQAFSRVRTAPRYRQNPKGVKAYLRPVHTDCSTCPYAVECLGHSGEIGGGRERISRITCTMWTCWWIKSGVASSWARRFHMRRKCFPSTSHIRVWISKGKAGVLAELGLPVALVEDEHRFILAYHILWDTSDVEVAVPIIDAVQAGFSRVQCVQF